MVIGGVSEGDRNVHSASLQPSMTKLPVQWSGKAHMPSGELIYSATKHGWSIAVGFVHVSYIQNKGACPPQKYDWIKIYIKQQKLCPALKWYHLSTSFNVLNTIYWDCHRYIQYIEISISWNSVARTRAADWASYHRCGEPGEVKNKTQVLMFNWNTSLMESPQLVKALASPCTARVSNVRTLA